ncbi:sensor histidine kinase [Clostridium sp. YIM B02551]|uniref:sensor histidine kinase n=1 Tax=Clostridium sp. YIM B02551 TaxID=2910679 RepID=UPI001EEAA1C3|nr:ATP-binding protein [Clostridium sp. YIM B02551]
MLYKVFDILNSFCQSILFVWISNNIAEKENKNTRNKSYLLVALIFAIINIFTYIPMSSPLANFIMVTLVLALIVIFYRKKVSDAFWGFGLAYAIITTLSYFLVTFYQHFFTKLNLGIPQDVEAIIFIYIPAFISYIFIYKYRKNLFEVVISLKAYKISIIVILLIDYAFIFIDTLRIEWTIESMGITFKFLLYFVSLIAFIFSLIYFAKINSKTREVELLNAELNDKIIELKKIKHDYGSEISSLYGLYQLGRYDRMGELLKGIVERYQNTSSVINLNVQANPMVTSILNNALSKGINIVAFDNADYENLSISDSELLKLLSNIINNAIDVLLNIQNATIKYNSYNSYDGIIVNIENNGPEIPKENREKIFKAGFSTKSDVDGERGYGLSIVRDVINKAGGEIVLRSTKSWTEFSIKIPYKRC